MRFQKRIFLLLLAALLSLSCFSAQAAETLDIQQVYVSEDEPIFYVGILANNSESLSEDDFRFTADGVSLPIRSSNVSVGHIIVINNTTFYSKQITAAHIIAAVKTYIQQLPAQDKVKFIYSDSSSDSGSYMSRSKALNYIDNLSFTNQGGSITSAISAGFQEARKGDEETPLKAIAIFADPIKITSRLSYNDSDGNNPVYVSVIVPVRKYYEEKSAKENYWNGKSYLANFVSKFNGSYIEIYQTGDKDDAKIDTSNISQIANDLRNVYTFAVNLSKLMPSGQTNEASQKYKLAIRAGNNKSSELTIKVATSLLPTATPKPTATPTIKVTETPNATEAPVVMPGDKTPQAKLVIAQLSKLGYLDNSPENYYEDGYSELVQGAFAEFCNDHGLELTNNISAEAYEVLKSTEPTPTPSPTPTATPTPSPTLAATATPEPEIPSDGLHLNDRDGEKGHAGTFIAQIQKQLTTLNCFDEEYAAGVFDEATLQAVNNYCITYGLTNDENEKNGASRSLCMTILANTELSPRQEKGFIDKAKDLLLRPLFLIGSFEVTMWMVVLLCAVLFIVIVVVLLAKGGNSDISEPPSRSESVVQYTPPAQSEVNSWQNSVSEDDEKTKPLGAMLTVTLAVSYQGEIRTLTASIEEKPYIIGRKKDCDLPLDSRDVTLSRQHAQLFARDGQRYIKNLSSNGTFVNGQKLTEEVEADNEKTMPLGASVQTASSEHLLSNGDVISMGNHTITVMW